MNKMGKTEKTEKTVKPDTWGAVDGLGRILPEHGSVGDRREKFVGIFYWTWHDRYDDPKNAVNMAWETPNRGQGTVNMQKVMEQYPQAKNDYCHPGWCGMGSGNGIGCGHWNEPIYGYYFSDDRWVIRRQAELLANAGVDAVFFDNTNGSDMWEKGYMAVGKTFEAAQRDGVQVPGIAFLLPLHYPDNPNNGEMNRIQLRELYQKVYKKGLFQSVWFYWKGKPLIMAYPDALDPADPLEAEILRFFTFRPCQPKYYDVPLRENMWGWLSVYPQTVYPNPDGTPEEICVGVAQNINAESLEQQKVCPMNGENIWGRSYTSLGFDPRPDAKLWGANFEEQWGRALQVNPEFVFVTGWNEWIAGHRKERFGVPNGICDEFDDEHSRDIEPSKGDLKDHYYYQLCANIRRFKGAGKQEPHPETPLCFDSPRAQWQTDTLRFYDYCKDLRPRNAQGYYHYASDTGRNAIVESGVAHDAQFLYLEAVCREALSPSTGKNWMRLLLRTDLPGAGFEGFQFIVNRHSPGAAALLERSLGGWHWEAAAECRWAVSGNRLRLALPRAALGLSNRQRFSLWFKWADNNLQQGDMLSLYTQGDCSPGARFTYHYIAR